MTHVWSIQLTQVPHFLRIKKKGGVSQKRKKKKSGSEVGEKTLHLKEDKWPIFLVIYASFYIGTKALLLVINYSFSQIS